MHTINRKTVEKVLRSFFASTGSRSFSRGDVDNMGTPMITVVTGGNRDQTIDLTSAVESTMNILDLVDIEIVDAQLDLNTVTTGLDLVKDYLVTNKTSKVSFQTIKDVFDTISKNDGVTSDVVAKKVKLNRNTAQQVLKVLRDAGAVTVTTVDGKNGGRPLFAYTIN